MSEYNQSQQPYDRKRVAFIFFTFCLSVFLCLPVIWAVSLLVVVLLAVSSLFTMTNTWNVLFSADVIESEPESVVSIIEKMVQTIEQTEDLMLSQASENVVITTMIKAPFMTEKAFTFSVTPRVSGWNRNQSFVENKQRLFLKQASAMDVLFEVAGKEMADLLGLSYTVPQNSVAIHMDLTTQQHDLSSHQFFPSREAMKRLGIVKPKIQNIVGKFIFHLKTSWYKKRAHSGELKELLFVQSFIPKAINGVEWCYGLFELLPKAIKVEKHEQSLFVLHTIDRYSFEEHVLLHIILGSKDANLGNTLFVMDAKHNKTKLYSVDLERIMPEDNYNVVKTIAMRNGEGVSHPMVERCVMDVFPMCIWLFGLPQADVPFSKYTMEKMLCTLDIERLKVYHAYKKLFTAKAVDAQLERVQCIKNAFEAACKQKAVTLTPKLLFCMFVNNHPSYVYLKKNLELSDFFTYLRLGDIPDYSNAGPEDEQLKQEIDENIRQNKSNFLSENSLSLSAAPRALLFQRLSTSVELNRKGKVGLALLEQTSEALRVKI